MNFKYFIIIFIFACVRLLSTVASKTEDEINENVLSEHKDKSSSLLSTFINDPTVPVFLVMGLASLATVLNFPKNENTTETIGRIKRSTSNSSFANNLLRILGNVQKAVEKYQQLENEIANELDEDISREYSVKSIE